MPRSRETDASLAQFNDLIQALLSGELRRTNFRSWEMQVLLDIEACDLPKSKFSNTLKRYQKAVHRHAAKGLGFPLLLSEYLESKGSQRKPAAAEGAAAERRKMGPL